MGYKVDQLTEFSFSHEECYNATTVVNLIALQLLHKRSILLVNVSAFMKAEKVSSCTKLCI